MHRLHRLDLVGSIFGEWSVLSKSEKTNKYGEIFWNCRCSCGTERTVVAGSLIKGKSKRCGSGECSSTFKHGHSAESKLSRAYTIWSGMKQRCDNPKAASYNRYGLRGIWYSDSWKSFENFLADMGEPAEGLSLERIDNDGNYCKENCKWATSKEQMRNRSVTRMVSVGKSEFSLPAIAEALGITRKLLTSKLDQGWTVSLTLTK